MTSNAENEKRGELAGRADGRCWAEHTTEHDDLRRVAAIVFQPGLDCYKALCDAVDPDDEFSEMEFKRYLFGDESAVLTNEYLARPPRRTGLSEARLSLGSLRRALRRADRGRAIAFLNGTAA